MSSYPSPEGMSVLNGGVDLSYSQQLLGHERLEALAIYTEVAIKQLIEVHA